MTRVSVDTLAGPPSKTDEGVWGSQPDYFQTANEFKRIPRMQRMSNEQKAFWESFLSVLEES